MRPTAQQESDRWTALEVRSCCYFYMLRMNSSITSIFCPVMDDCEYLSALSTYSHEVLGMIQTTVRIGVLVLR